jgi:hypothetical protein
MMKSKSSAAWKQQGAATTTAATLVAHHAEHGEDVRQDTMHIFVECE